MLGVKGINAVKSSASLRFGGLKGNVIDHISKDSGSYMPKRFDYVDPQGRLKSWLLWILTGNKFYLSDYQDIDGGFVAFGGSSKGGKITGKGKIRTGKLDFEDVYFVKELKFNFFSVSQLSDKKNSVLFTETECRKPALNFMRPFGCLVTILNTLDHLVPLIVDVVMMCYTIRSADSGLVLPCALIVSFPAGYMVFVLVAHCYYWSLVVTPGCMSVTAGRSRFVLALQTDSIVYIRHWAIHYGLMSYSKVPLIVDVVMMCYTIRSAASGLVLPCTLVVSFPAGYMVFLLVAHCYYWSLVVTPGCMSVTAGSSRFVLALQTVSIGCVTFLLVVCAG
ncbi:hypothetical protein Tco_0544815 [Tanacetum coccineum]